jgi:hypothetical protein
MTTRKPQTPTAGDALVAAVTEDLEAEDVSLDSRETELLERARAAADKIEMLESEVQRTGLTYTDKDGVLRPSALLAEIRQQNVILMRALGGIRFEVDEKKAVDPAKSRAGQASWAARSAVGNLRGIIPRDAS